MTTPKTSKVHTILVVEDDPDIRATLADFFQESGFDTKEAENGQSAIELLSRGYEPDVILLDMAMPVMDGAAMLKVMAQNDVYRKIPVVVVSADTTIRPPGAAALVRKPFDVVELLDVVSAHLRFRSG